MDVFYGTSVSEEHTKGKIKFYWYTIKWNCKMFPNQEKCRAESLKFLQSEIRTISNMKLFLFLLLAKIWFLWFFRVELRKDVKMYFINNVGCLTLSREEKVHMKKWTAVCNFTEHGIGNVRNQVRADLVTSGMHGGQQSSLVSSKSQDTVSKVRIQRLHSAWRCF